MLLEQVKEDIQSGGLGAGNAFSIAASAKAFEVLSNSLYQNKVLAVIREITCNAVDAHRMVGKPVSDIQIHMPTYLAPHFAVRDFGPGLSHDDVLSLYTTYFRSTKDASNALIGGFGLGSKSPFAVADQFTVTSWQDGECRTYVCYKDGGVPAINHIATAPSDEANGLEVRVAVPVGGLSRWADEAVQLFRWWPEVPAGLPGVSYALADERVLVKSARMEGGYPEWAITSATGSPTVLMGGVPYALNLSAIGGLPFDQQNSFANLGAVLGFEIGALNISPSREALSYDPATSAKLLDRLQAVKQELVSTVEARLDALPTLWDARRYVFTETNGAGGGTAEDILRRFRSNLKFYWKGRQLSQAVDLDMSQDFSSHATLTASIKQSHRKTWDKSAYAYNFTATLPGVSAADFWLWESVVTGKTYRKAQYAAETEAPATKPAYGYGYRQPTRRVYILSGVPFDEAEKVFAAKGLPPLRKVADLPDPPATAPGIRKQTLTKGYTYDASTGSWSRTENSIDLKQPGYWGKFFNGSCTDMNVYKIQAYRKMGLIADGLPVVGFTKSRWDGANFEARMEKAGWKRLTKDLIQEAPLAKVQQEAYSQAMRTAIERSSDFLKVLAKMKGLVKAPDFDGMVELLVKDCKARAWDRSYTWEYADHFSDAQKAAADKGRAEARVVLDKWAGWLAAHPLLKCALSAPGVSAQDIADYLNR